MRALAFVLGIALCAGTEAQESALLFALQGVTGLALMCAATWRVQR